MASTEGERLEPAAFVRCAGCEREIGEDDAQAQRWGYWFRVGELYPYCPECAVREFGRRE